jgi:hypothetical protein
MTPEQDEKVRTWAALAERDGDPEAAEAIRALLAERDENRDAYERKADECTDALDRAERAEKELTKARAELARVQGLPDLEWARASAVIVQGLALHARTDQPAAKRMADTFDRAKTYVGRLKERAELAEADNAALLDRVRAVRARVVMFSHAEACEYDEETDTAPECRCPLERLPELDAALSAAHPGAALLAEVEALREVYETACEMVAGDASTNAWARLTNACAAVDALKERAT